MTIFQRISRVYYPGSKYSNSGIFDPLSPFVRFHQINYPTLIHRQFTCQPWKIYLKSSRKSMPTNLLFYFTTLIHWLFSRSVIISNAYQRGRSYSIQIFFGPMTDRRELMVIVLYELMGDQFAMRRRYKKISLKVRMETNIWESESSIRMRWIFSTIMFMMTILSLELLSTDFNLMQDLPGDSLVISVIYLMIVQIFFSRSRAMTTSTSLGLTSWILETIIPYSTFYFWKSVKSNFSRRRWLLNACVVNRIASTRVSIQISLHCSSSHTNSSSISFDIKMLIASYREIDLSTVHIEELIGMQSQAELVRRMSVSRCLKLC